MKRFKILFVVGKDRPGIVDRVSALLFEKGANIEDSRMAVLGGCFSIMALFSCREAEMEKIVSDLGSLKEEGFDIFLHDAEASLQPGTPGQQSLQFDIRSMDHPGIVNKIVHRLHEFQVNILSLKSQIIPAPLSGAPLFDLHLEGTVPGHIPLPKVTSALLAMAEEMDLDVTLRND